MTTLEDAWTWYRSASEGTKWLTHLAKFWGTFPWEQADEWVDEIAKDNVLRHIEVSKMTDTAKVVRTELDDLAVLVLFSVFEANVRDHLTSQLQPEVDTLRHPSLKKAGDEVMDAIAHGSIGRLLQSFKLGDSSKELVMQVDQVRDHRNWVAHGRRADMLPKAFIRPEDAYERLTQFLKLIRSFDPFTPPVGEAEGN
jgi:hypothetical protein